MEFIKYLENKNIFNIDKKQTIILVGSAPSILNSNFGEKINNFNIIVRFNDNKIEEFKKDIGTKTNILVMNTGSFNSKIKSYNKIFGENNTNYDIKNKNKNIDIIKKEYDIDISNRIYIFDKYFSGGLQNIYFLELIKNNILHVPYPIYDTIIPDKKYNNIRKLSLGITFIIILCHNGYKPTITGITLDENITKMDDYYRTRSSISYNHDFIFEIKYLNQMIDEKYIYVLK